MVTAGALEEYALILRAKEYMARSLYLSCVMGAVYILVRGV